MRTVFGNEAVRLLNRTAEIKLIGKKRFRSVIANLTAVIALAVSLQGCVPLIVMDSMDRQHYSDYVTQTNQINLKRQEAGLQPVQVMTFQQWKGNSVL